MEKFELPDVLNEAEFANRIFKNDKVANKPVKWRAKKNRMGTARFTEKDKIAIKNELLTIAAELIEFAKKDF
ncbi:MAG: hypothetical protein KA974_11760 [Saprospiraceae bacterium]|nr:hypothetical protein [Saprospiraceae bacterium]